MVRDSCRISVSSLRKAACSGAPDCLRLFSLPVSQPDVHGLADQIEQVLLREIDELRAEKDVIMDVVDAEGQTRQADFGGIRLQLHPRRRQAVDVAFLRSLSETARDRNLLYPR